MPNISPNFRACSNFFCDLCLCCQIHLEITLVLLRRCLKVKKMPKIVAPHFSQDSYATQIFFRAMLMLLINLCGFTVATLLVSGLLISRPLAGFLCLHVHLHFPPLPQILYAYSKKICCSQQKRFANLA